jgi:hypothetical protein
MIARKQRERQSLSLLLGIGSAVVVKFAIYLLNLFLGYESRENVSAKSCFLGMVPHFLKFHSTMDSVQPSEQRLLPFFSLEVSSAAVQKAALGIVSAGWHLL